MMRITMVLACLEVFKSDSPKISPGGMQYENIENPQTFARISRIGLDELFLEKKFLKDTITM